MKNIYIKILVFFALLLAIYISGCRKGDNSVYTSAIVINTGAVAADGCGWVTKIEDTDYSAINLGEKFKEDGLKVSIRYQKLSSNLGVAGACKLQK